jgi:C-terminal processing protease CtpA/Prc
MPSTKGVILDLRLNAGGNSFPMITGVHNLFGKQKHRKDGKSFAGDWNVVNNELRLTETFYVRLQKNCGDLTHLPVAVLIGPVTGSSGEFIAIGFSARQKTILIGEPTAGFTTANEGFELPGKDNGIVLAVSEAMDRNGNFYPNGVKPTITVSGDDFFHREADPKIQAAVKWLEKQQRSRKTRRK